jgi:hypothetical protein
MNDGDDIFMAKGTMSLQEILMNLKEKREGENNLPS